MLVSDEPSQGDRQHGLPWESGRSRQKVQSISYGGAGFARSCDADFLPRRRRGGSQMLQASACPREVSREPPPAEPSPLRVCLTANICKIWQVTSARCRMNDTWVSFVCHTTEHFFTEGQAFPSSTISDSELSLSGELSPHRVEAFSR